MQIIFFFWRCANLVDCDATILSPGGGPMLVGGGCLVILSWGIMSDNARIRKQKEGAGVINITIIGVVLYSSFD